MTKPIEIVNRGRGPQLSTSRITVQDLVPYLKKGWSHDQIMTAMPLLTVAEIQVVERYVRENYGAVMDQDRRICDRNAHRVVPPEIEAIRRKGHDKLLVLKEQFDKRNRERNGD